MPNKEFEIFKQKLLEITHIQTVLQFLDWDLSVNTPEKAFEARGELVSYLSGLLHDKFVDPKFVELLKSQKKLMDKHRLDENQSAIVREVNRDYEKEKKLPLEFIKELSKATSSAHHGWVQARKESNFQIFAPKLSKIVELKRKEAKFLGYKNSPYDALLDNFEPGSKSEDLSILFSELKEFLVPFLDRIQKSKVKINPKILEGKFESSKQIDFNRRVISQLGFDFQSGRIDTSAHPFATNFHPTDVRLTTRYKESDVLYSLGSIIHESGHGMYEQGLDPKHFGTPLGSSMSLGIHESQSRLWENLVGNSMPFWKYFYPLLRKEFPRPFSKIKLTNFYNAINSVRPSLIRTESDEVTYNLHIIIRFEIEKELIEGSIEVHNLPEIWNEKHKKYLGVKVPNDVMGVLQDVHWSAGLFGYFPTYTLGNLYSVEFYNVAKKQIKNLEEQFEKGDFSSLKNWLNKNIHQHGKFYSAETLVLKVTGEPLNIGYYKDYLKKKYNEIYELGS